MWVLYMKWSSLFLAMRSILSKRKNALSFFTLWTRKEPSRTSSPNPLRSGPVQFSKRLSISYRIMTFALITYVKPDEYIPIQCKAKQKLRFICCYDATKWSVFWCLEHLMVRVTCSLTACSCFLFMSLMYHATAVMVMMASSTTSYPGSLLSKCLDSSYHKRETPNHQMCNRAGMFSSVLSLQVINSTDNKSYIHVSNLYQLTCRRRWYLRILCTGFNRYVSRGSEWHRVACLSWKKRTRLSFFIQSLRTVTELDGNREIDVKVQMVPEGRISLPDIILSQHSAGGL